jgi:hypothetical protein
MMTEPRSHSASTESGSPGGQNGQVAPSALRESVLGFMARCQAPEPGRYRYAGGCLLPTVYSSCYAAMGRHLLNDLPALAAAEREDWIAYLQSHQDEDGLFRDPVVFGEGWYHGDPLWCGRSHLTCHVVAALTCLGGVAAEPLRWLEPWLAPDALRGWLEARDWGERVAWTGNEIMNVGVLLQYARDFQNDSRAGHAAAVLVEWLATHHVRPETGVWGGVDVTDPVWRSHAVQAAYHWWPLFFHDGVEPPYLDRAIDTVLATQNARGGFGWGVHHAAEPFLSSACEDIDSIDPLCRMMGLTEYRRADIQNALACAADWVLTNQMPDGGFVFVRNLPFEYGHPQLRSDVGHGAMFPTWFRLLSLGLIGGVLPGHSLGAYPWQFVSCPGMQFSPPEMKP